MMWQHQGLTGVSQWLIGIDCSWACEGSPSRGEYVRYWVPELSKLPLQYLHCPHEAMLQD
ncbi:CRYD, partial [Symbiodinium sp. KB8]